MELLPVRYECPTHQVELTDLVVEVLGEDEPAPVAYRRLRRWAPFRVVVTCPGDGPAAAAHSVTCSGEYR